MPPIWVGFRVQNSLDKGPFFGKFPLNMSGFARNCEILLTDGKFSAKIHHKNGFDRNCPQLEEGSFLKTRRQTPVHLQVMYPLPPPPPPRRGCPTVFSSLIVLGLCIVCSCIKMATQGPGVNLVCQKLDNHI